MSLQIFTEFSIEVGLFIRIVTGVLLTSSWHRKDLSKSENPAQGFAEGSAEFTQGGNNIDNRFESKGIEIMYISWKKSGIIKTSKSPELARKHTHEIQNFGWLGKS